jgi:hypothetical protein
MSDPKSSTLPPLRVSEKLRSEAEGVLAPGETLSAFVLESVSRNIEFRKSQKEFIARGIASADRARQHRSHVPAGKVITALRKRLTRAQRTRT